MLISKRVFIYFVLPLFLLYFVPNLYFGLSYLKEGYVVFEGEYFPVKYGLEYLIFYLVCFFMFFLFGVYGAFLGPKKEVILSKRIWVRVHYFLVFCCFLSIILTLWGGLNIAGKQNSDHVPLLFKMISLLFSPDYMVPFFLVFKFWSFKKYAFISILYLVALLIKGWMGGVLYILFAWLINFSVYRNIWPKNTAILFILVFNLTLISLPALQFFKFYFREPSGDLVDSLMIYLSSPLAELYFDVAETIFSRFQSVDLYFVVMNEVEYLSNLYQGGRIVPSYLDNTIFYGLGLWGEGLPFGQMLASHLVGQDLQWATHPLLFGWISVEGWLSLLYFIILTVLAYWLSHKLGGSQLKAYMLIYLVVSGWHGWMSAYFSLVLYIFLFLIYIRFLSLSIRRKF